MNFEARRGHQLPPDLPLDVGAVLEPIMVAKHAARRAGITAEDSVLIVGCGPVGLGLLLVCKQIGVKKVIVSEVYERRIELANEFGADLVLNPKTDDVVSIAKREFDGLGPQFAFDISGNEASLDTAIRSIRIQGTVVVVALFEGPIVFKPNDLLLVEKNMKWVLAYSEEDVNEVIRIFGGQAEWREKVASMISMRLGLNDAVSKGFRGLVDNRAEHIKVLITSNKSIIE
jgi:threonine dehydrogenase-like Zn-dependent dehydrogenase